MPVVEGAARNNTSAARARRGESAPLASIEAVVVSPYIQAAARHRTKAARTLQSALAVLRLRMSASNAARMRAISEDDVLGCEEDNSAPDCTAPHLIVSGHEFRAIDSVCGPPAPLRGDGVSLSCDGLEYMYFKPSVRADVRAQLERDGASLLKLWQMFVPEELILLTTVKTNLYIANVQQGLVPRPERLSKSTWPPKYLQKEFKPFSPAEVYTAFAVRYCMAVFRMPLLDFWKDDEFRRCKLVRSAIPRERFKHLWSCMNFTYETPQEVRPIPSALPSGVAVSATVSVPPVPPPEAVVSPAANAPTVTPLLPAPVEGKGQNLEGVMTQAVRPDASCSLHQLSSAGAEAAATHATPPLPAVGSTGVPSATAAATAARVSENARVQPEKSAVEFARPVIELVSAAVDRVYECGGEGQTQEVIADLARGKWSWLVMDAERRPLFGVAEKRYFRSSVPLPERGVLVTGSGDSLSKRVVNDVRAVWQMFLIGMDLMDLHSRFFTCEMPRLRDWHSLVLWVLDWAMIHTATVWTSLHGTKVRPREHMLNCCKQIVDSVAPPSLKRKRDEDDEQSDVRSKRPRFNGTGDWTEERLKDGPHWPQHNDKQARCRVCFDLAKAPNKSNCSRTSWSCSLCNVPLCIKRGKDCYRIWHTQLFN